MTPARPAEHWLSTWTTRTLVSRWLTSNTMPTPKASAGDLHNSRDAEDRPLIRLLCSGGIANDTTSLRVREAEGER